ncbi:FimV/HubP family polar landmark protein [Burkholderia stagnalis]
MSRIFLFPRQSRLSRAVRGALAILALGAAAAAWAAGDAPASAGGLAPLTVTVQPGQSLNDLAIAATQSHDPGVLARAGRALFDANPQAFMKRDPSRLKIGATLTVPALDATGAVLMQAGASGVTAASVASAAVAASGGAAGAQHAASAPHGASSVMPATPAASAAHAGAASDANVAEAVAVAPAASGATAVQGASAVDGSQPAAAAAGASGPHVWSGAIQAAPSASETAAQPARGGEGAGTNPPAGAAVDNAASQPRPSSLQQLLALKNRVLMELQKHGIGKPAATNVVVPAPVPAAPRAAAANDAGAAIAASAASAAASGAAAGAVEPASASVQPAAPVTAASPASRSNQIDWRPASAAGAAVVVLVAGFLWRKRRKARQADALAGVGAAVPGRAGGEAGMPVEQELPIQPEMPVARDAASDLTLAAAVEAAETAAASRPEVAPSPEEAKPHDVAPGSPSARTEAAQVDEIAPASHAADPVADTPDAPPVQTPAAPAAAATQHEALMQNAISALNSLDMPLPPRTTDESPFDADEATARAERSEGGEIATNGQSAPRPPIGVNHPTPEDSVDQDDELEWDPDAATPAGYAGGSSTPSSPPPLGGAQFGALKLDFDLDLPSASGAALPALTPEELARIARNKLDLAAEYVALGDLSGARTLLQEVVGANDAATRDDARALLAKLADDA